jgi:hypothetical protein
MAIVERSNEKAANVVARIVSLFFKLVLPRANLPYAAEYRLCGPMPNTREDKAPDRNGPQIEAYVRRRHDASD